MCLVVAYSLHAYQDHSCIGLNTWGTIESPECQCDATAAADADDDVLLVWNVIATCAASI
jgi:hypothetical protein